MSEAEQIRVLLAVDLRPVVQGLAEVGESAHRAAAAMVMYLAAGQGYPTQVVTGHDGVSRVRIG